MRVAVSIIGVLFLLLAIVLVWGPISNMGGPGRAVLPEDVPQYCWGVACVAVGALLVTGASAAGMHSTCCPRCGRRTAGGIHCDDCWREVSQEVRDA